MNSAKLQLPLFVLVLATLMSGNMAMAQQAQSLSVYPSSAIPGISSLEVTIIGGRFGTHTDVHFRIAGTRDPGEVSVSAVKILSPEKLVATIEVEPSAAINVYDIDVSLGGAERLTGAKLFTVTSQSQSTTVGCTGAESWRRRIQCKRGTIH